MATETTKLTFVEGAAATTPAASRTVIYAKADGLMYSKDDAGAELLMSSGSGLTNPMTTAGDIIVGGASGTPARLAAGTAGYPLVGGGAGVASAYAVAGKFHGCRITEGTGQIIAGDGTNEAMTSNDAEIYDTDAFHDTSSNTTRLTAPFNGYYRVTGEIFFPANATGYRQVLLRKDGATQIGLTRVAANSAGAASEVQAYAEYFFTAGQYVECEAGQTSTVDLTCFLSMFSMSLMGT